MTERLFIFGIGYSGLEIARQAKVAGWNVGGTVRDADKARQYKAEGIETHLFDGISAPPDDALRGVSHVLCTIAPGGGGDPALRTCARLMREARWLGYLSTTGVYGDHGGGWVDEETPPKPTQPRSIERLATERAWQAMALDCGAPVDIFRLPGIYGPGRSAIDQARAGNARRIDKPGQVFSRIHVQDIAQAVIAAISWRSAGRIYNVADDLPAPNSEVIAYACELMALPVPPLIPWDQASAGMSDMARSFYAENRRVRNARMKNDLGVSLRYPTYREGLRAIARASP